MQKCGGKDRIDGPAKIDGLVEFAGSEDLYVTYNNDTCC